MRRKTFKTAVLARYSPVPTESCTQRTAP